jgi:mono/diheme cytochrome c family protein
MQRACVVVLSLAWVAACTATAPPGADDPAQASIAETSGLGAAEAATASDEELALGKLIYDTHCARCHGADGKSDTYPFILTLDGIGKRYTLEQILEETWATGFVAPQQFTQNEQRAMAKYVATL